MPVANWLDYFFKDFVHHVTDGSFERLALLRRNSILNRNDRFVHPPVNVEKYLEDLCCDLRAFKQVFPRR